MQKLAIIGGSGLYQMESMEITSQQQIDTPYGKPSADYIHGSIGNAEVVFLSRHGNPHTLPPHKINYRANIWGLKQLGITEIIAVAAVGGISSQMAPAHIAIPDQLIDYSYGREHTFFAEDLQSVTHIDFTFPYHPILRDRLIQSAKSLSIKISPVGVYGCTQGPRLETAAEIKRMQHDGCDLVGMTGMPEAALAKELEMKYASIAVVANWAAGKSEGEITMSEIEQHLSKGMIDVQRILSTFINDYTFL